MVVQMQGVYQVSVDMMSERLGCPSIVLVKFVVEINLDFDKI